MPLAGAAGACAGTVVVVVVVVVVVGYATAPFVGAFDAPVSTEPEAGGTVASGRADVVVVDAVGVVVAVVVVVVVGVRGRCTPCACVPAGA